MQSKIKSVIFHGLNLIDLVVECGIYSRGIPRFDIVGLAARSVEESKMRIKSAFLASGLEFPNKRIVVNLAPADINKEGSYLDLPIAVSILCANTIDKHTNISCETLGNSFFMGELSLDGSIRGVNGVFLAAMHCVENSIRSLYIPYDNLNEVANFKQIDVYAFNSLTELLNSNKNPKLNSGLKKDLIFRGGSNLSCIHISSEHPTFESVVGQENAKRALEISAAGGHNILLYGPPGVGKTVLSKAFPSILPKLSETESIEVTKIYSTVGKLTSTGGLISHRPFRNPHHSITRAGLLGGGAKVIPGEITLAHRGVLFLDELNEFQKSVLESLRLPMEEGAISIIRSHGRYDFPAKFLLIAGCNPCPCGFYGSSKCRCSPKIVEQYRRRLSGPLLDRIDLHVKVDSVKPASLLLNATKIESSTDVQSRVQKARNKQEDRFKGTTLLTNSEMSYEQVKHFCLFDQGAREKLLNLSYSLPISTRGLLKVIKIAQTITDLTDGIKITKAAILEAYQYRSSF